jgi:hypothetical protein
LPVYLVDAGEDSGCSVEHADFFRAQRQRGRRYVLFQMGKVKDTICRFSVSGNQSTDS